METDATQLLLLLLPLFIYLLIYFLKPMSAEDEKTKRFAFHIGFSDQLAFRRRRPVVLPAPGKETRVCG